MDFEFSVPIQPRFLAGIPLSVKTWAIQQLGFYGTALLFEYFDKTTFRRLRVREPDRKPFNQLLLRVLVNQCCILLPCMMLTQVVGICFTGPTHLHPINFLLILPAMAVGHDVVQYLTHRYLLHSPNIKLMRLLRHSVHHMTTASRGISACYMSSVDFLLEIVFPYLVPLILVGGGGADIRLQYLVAGLGAMGGVYEHSGYDFGVSLRSLGKASESTDTAENSNSYISLAVLRALGGIFDNRAHGEHHARANVSFADGFGNPGVCDTLFGTRFDLSGTQWTLAEKEWRSQTVSSRR
ncbi:uncharacterized protein N7498_008271 [Penicillium cinerascens]|uniref:Fatty acid hydroxylase domain-containing protein n=1 Tax=Penicillium cinerascens TaxID=70096 RepID=A0A9W9JD40_9EURO|nr:uncharacterized protein N7498_008271 [Penicillium cinerascens]KAJ5194833.1 hypothetical protein N7498_008271 [Penicillium cinerascens]